MLKYTGVELDLITDPDMHQMVEKSMRGLVTFVISTPPRIIPTDTYNGNEEARTLTYQDAKCHKCFLLKALNGYRNLMRLIF